MLECKYKHVDVWNSFFVKQTGASEHARTRQGAEGDAFWLFSAANPGANGRISRSCDLPHRAICANTEKTNGLDERSACLSPRVRVSVGAHTSAQRAMFLQLGQQELFVWLSRALGQTRRKEPAAERYTRRHTFRLGRPLRAQRTR